MPAVAGPRVHGVSIATTTFLVAFVMAVLVLIAADLFYAKPETILEVLRLPEVQHAIYLSLVTTAITLVLVIVFAVPMGYALSRYRFPGSVVLDAIVDLPIVLPPVVVGVSLLVFFRTSAGQWIESVPWLGFVYTVKGIVLCQFFMSVSYAIRASKASFDGIDRRLEHLALTLGCTQAQAFLRVSLPMARNGLVAGAVMAWARAVGVFSPVYVLAGAVRELMPTTVWLELSIGRIEPALALSLVMLAIAMVALVLIHLLGQTHRWWGL